MHRKPLIPIVRLPRFSLRELFLTTTLIAIGVGGCVWVCRTLGASDPALEASIFLVSLGLIGAGIGTPFQAKTNGAFVILLVGSILMVLAILR